MEAKLLETLATTAPSAVAVIITVVLFLRSMKDRDLLLTSTLTALHSESEESRKACTQVIDENTKVLGQHIELGRELSSVLKEVSENVKTCQLVRQELNHRKGQV